MPMEVYMITQNCCFFLASRPEVSEAGYRLPDGTIVMAWRRSPPVAAPFVPLTSSPGQNWQTVVCVNGHWEDLCQWLSTTDYDQSHLYTRPAPDPDTPRPGEPLWGESLADSPYPVRPAAMLSDPDTGELSLPDPVTAAAGPDVDDGLPFSLPDPVPSGSGANS